MCPAPSVFLVLIRIHALICLEVTVGSFPGSVPCLLLCVPSWLVRLPCSEGLWALSGAILLCPPWVPATLVDVAAEVLAR